MKPFIFEVMKEILLKHNPRNICEIGTHRAGTAVQMINLLAADNTPLHYTGYDIFDHAMNNPEFNQQERNGKNGALYQDTYNKINDLTKRYPGFTFELFKGLTSETLTTPRKFDFVYIDGGHSYESVSHDYSMVKDSKVIVFDDYKIPAVRQFVDEITGQGVPVEIVRTPSKHTWGVIVNE